MLLSKSYGSLLVSEFDSLILMKDIGEINISEVLRVHDYSYVNVLKNWINKTFFCFFLFAGTTRRIRKLPVQLFNRPTFI